MSNKKKKQQQSHTFLYKQQQPTLSNINKFTIKFGCEHFYLILFIILTL